MNRRNNNKINQCIFGVWHPSFAGLFIIFLRSHRSNFPSYFRSFFLLSYLDVWTFSFSLLISLLLLHGFPFINHIHLIFCWLSNFTFALKFYVAPRTLVSPFRSGSSTLIQANYPSLYWTFSSSPHSHRSLQLFIAFLECLFFQYVWEFIYFFLLTVGMLFLLDMLISHSKSKSEGRGRF